MQESMRNYIMETPDQCQQNIMQAAELTQIITDEFCKQTYKRIQIVASGSSYNAAVTARYFMEKTLKLKVEVLTSFSTLNYETMFDAETFYIGLGQSGRSTNTNAAMRKIIDRGYSLIGLTGNVESEMKCNCTQICNWGVGIEKIGYVTKGYTTAVLFLMLFAVEAARKTNRLRSQEADSILKEMLSMTECMKKVIHQAESWYKANIAGFYTEMNRIQITGYGSNLGVAMEGALKIEETLARAATAYEIEEYLHGPCYETTPDRTVMIIDAPGSASSRAYQLYQKLFALTPKTYLITTRKCEGEHVLSLPYPVKEELSVFINIIPFQLIAALGREQGGNPYEDRFTVFGDAMSTKSPRKGNEVGL